MIVIDARGVAPGPVAGSADPAIRGVRTMRHGPGARFLVLFHDQIPRYRLEGAPRGVVLSFAPTAAHAATAPAASTTVAAR